MKFKKLLSASIGLLSVPFVTVTPLVATSCSDASSIVNKLLEIQDIKRVDIIKGDTGFAKKLVLYVLQPMDWNNKDVGTFTQRVEFGFNGYKNVNMVNIGGYEISDSRFDKKTSRELVTRYNSNYLNIEYRYFGESWADVPYTPKVTEYWKYLTIDNAIKDFHHINEILRPVLKGKWVISGGSKGGQTTDTYAMMYPEDANAFVAYVGPRCHLNTHELPLIDSNRQMLDWVLNSIGNYSSLTEDGAEEKRLEIFKFQNYLLTKKATDFIKDDFYNHFIDQNYAFIDYVNNNHAALYYCCVMDIAVGVWQSNGDMEVIKTINNMPDDNNKLLACKKQMLNNYEPSDFNLNGVTYPYNIQGWKEMGLYNLDPGLFISRTTSYNEKYPSLNLPVPSFEYIDSTDYNTLRYKCMFTPEFMSNVSYDSTIKTNLEAWIDNNNKANVIMIFGEKDPWSAYMWESIGSEKIHLFMNDNSHNSTISNLDEENKKLCWEMLDGWLK